MDTSAVRADGVVTSTAGLDVIRSVLASFPADESVARSACCSLCTVARKASPAALALMREGGAVELLMGAKRSFPDEGADTVRAWADATLALVSPELQLHVMRYAPPESSDEEGVNLFGDGSEDERG